MRQHNLAAAPDSIREALRAVFADPKYDWDRARDPWAWLRELFVALQRWLMELRETNAVAYWLLVGILLLALAAIVAHASVLVYRALRARPVAAARAATEPSGVRRGADWYLVEARRAEHEGRLLQSLVLRFAALVHRLEAASAVRVHPSKTPLEYAREATLDGDRRAAFVALVRDYYRYLFGRAPLDRAALAAFDERAATLIDGRAAA